MSSIQTGIELQDNFSGVMYAIIDSVNMAVSSLDDLSQSMNADVDTGSLEAARNEVEQMTDAVDELNAAVGQQPDIAPPVVDGGNGQVINVDVNPYFLTLWLKILNQSDLKFSQTHPRNPSTYLFSGNQII